jgi:hypothetical protein
MLAAQLPALSETIVVAIGLWYVTRILMYSDGPKQILFHFRRLLGRYGHRPPGSIGDMLTCFFCTSFWVTLPAIVLLGYPFWQTPIFCGLATIFELAMERYQWVHGIDD